MVEDNHTIIDWLKRLTPWANKRPCPSREELQAYNLGKTSKEKLESIAAHLETCLDCFEILVNISDSDDSILASLRKSPDDEKFLDEPEYQQAVARFEAIGDISSVPVHYRESPVSDLPKKFGRYQLLEELGRGGMGTVYLARDLQLNREVALKIPHFKPDDNPALLKRFYREARAAAAIEHPNLCPVHDVGEIDGLPYISMALVRGVSLSKLIKDRQLSNREAAEIVRKLALAVDKAHEEGIVHRDIKPSNVMITEEGEPILMDFGLAQHWKVADVRLTHAGLIVGTPSYMSPEQVEAGPEKVDPRSDVYSLGVVLYELLADDVPFRGPLLSVLSQLVLESPQRPSECCNNVDRRLEEICLKAIFKQPVDRYQSAAEMAEALEEYLQADPQAGGTGSRWRWLALGVATVAAFILFAGIILIKTGEGTLLLEVNQPDVNVTIDGKRVHIKSPRDEIDVMVGRHNLEVSKEGFHTHTEAFTVMRGGKVELKAWLDPLDKSSLNKNNYVTVTVGNPGNTADDTGYGRVDYVYRIGKYEVTNAQYCEFLNAVAKTDTNHLYYRDMGESIHNGGIVRTNESGSFAYETKDGMRNKPVTYVNFYSALRFANWLHNGKPTGLQNAKTTEDGAYDMSLGSKVVRKSDALFFLPSEDEWYKAAYYKGGGMDAGYWDYATQSNTAPISERPPGGRNSANYDFTGKTWGITEVGAYTHSPSSCGTFDQNGNVWEWTEGKYDSTDRVTRGGAHGSYGVESLPTSHRFHASASGGIGGGNGFRIACVLSLADTLPKAESSHKLLTEGLLAQYTFNGNVNDISGNDYHGTLLGPTLTADRFGNPNSAYLFDSPEDLIQLPHQVLDGLTDFSYFGVMKFHKLRSMKPGFPEEYLFSAAKNNDNYCTQLNVSSDFVHVSVNNSGPPTVKHHIENGEWISIAVSHNSKTGMSTVYVNGSDAGSLKTSTDQIDVAPGGFWIGNDQDRLGQDWVPEQQFYGVLDEVRFYNRSLTGTEIRQLHNCLFDPSSIPEQDLPR